MKKRGWIRILEATIAVLIVSASMIVVYSQHPSSGQETEDYVYSLQREILSDIGMNRSLRLAALGVDEETSGDSNYMILNDFIKGKLLDNFGYLLLVCDLSTTDFCKMETYSYKFTSDYDVFVEDFVIFSELGEGGGEEVYSPRRVRLFFWEGGFPEDYCMNECSNEGSFLTCSSDLKRVLSKSCAENVDSSCLEVVSEVEAEDCDAKGMACENAVCMIREGEGYSELTCGKNVLVESGCVSNFDDECDEWDEGRDVGGCGFFNSKDRYECWNVEQEVTDCELDPSCSAGFDLIERKDCVGVVPKIGELVASYSNLHYESSLNRWYYNLVISEIGGAGVTLSHRQRCWLYIDGCESIVYDPVAKFGTAQVAADGQVSVNDRWFWTSRHPQQMIETWYGEDENRNTVEVSYSIDTD